MDFYFFAYLYTIVGEKMDIKSYGSQLLRLGFRRKASDLYIFPTKSGYALSFRYHQDKQFYEHLSRENGEKLILYFKFLADMDVAEKRRIQVGAGEVKTRGRQRRLRFSTVGNFQNQESLVVRFLHDFTSQRAYKLFFPYQLHKLRQEISWPGLYLFSGPTGSGKSTTMYHLAKSFAAENQQIITIEDPVEIYADEFLQLQLNQKIALDYEKLVKVCLRHRPDILIVGEIRDQETAQAVVRGALTGHTIYSTIHGLNKESIIPRLLELGVAPKELEQCLRGIIYQRLLPFKCPYCPGKCSVYCEKRESGVLFDTTFYRRQGEVQKISSTSWQKTLLKAWSYGYLNVENYWKEC